MCRKFVLLAVNSRLWGAIFDVHLFGNRQEYVIILPRRKQGMQRKKKKKKAYAIS
jgi:hypothetical protein